MVFFLLLVEWDRHKTIIDARKQILYMTKTNTKFNWFKMFWEGFTNMTTLGKTLWIIVIIKLIFMFFILKPFFSPNYLNTNFDNAEDKADHVRKELIDKK